MPRYKKDINFIIPSTLIEEMLKFAKRPRDRFLFSILYLTGARPSEIRLLTKDDIKIGEVFLNINLRTLKLKKKRFHPLQRNLEFKIKDTPFIEEIISWHKECQTHRLMPITLRRVEQLVEEASGGVLCPYNMRHTRFTKLSLEGASMTELMYFKGSETTDSVENYIKAKPVKIHKFKIE